MVPEVSGSSLKIRHLALPCSSQQGGLEGRAQAEPTYHGAGVRIHISLLLS